MRVVETVTVQENDWRDLIHQEISQAIAYIFNQQIDELLNLTQIFSRIRRSMRHLFRSLSRSIS
jgi:hypothetical protein